MKKILWLGALVIGLLINTNVQAQYYDGGEMTWEELGRIEWKNYYDELLGIDVQEPIFNSDLMMKDGEMITITGFIIPVDTDDNTMILSAFPFSNCFFCGNAGPETVMQLDLKHDRSLLNKKVTLKGRLKLNQNDFYKLVYNLKDSEVINVQ
ncbi:hypothetical protein V6R21_27710 [Limibacter armeniacum]|uniref:hypothetical protein n=1 Tax=Limibacter armeniacum TaxID=466084 RepID=UPI002FE6A437